MFESCFELKPAFDILAQRPDKLMLVPGEMSPTSRTLESDVPSTAMENLEHLGQYVYEMTQAKIQAFGAENVLTEGVDPSTVAMDEDEIMDPIPEEGEPEDEGENENDAMRETALE